MQTIKVPSEGLQVKLEVNDGVVTIHGIEPIEQTKAYGDMVFDVPVGDTIYVVMNNGYVDDFKYYADELSKTVVSMGVFLTREAAQKEADRRNAIAKLKQSKGARPFVFGEANWNCKYSHNTKSIYSVYSTCSEAANTVYFDTEENCRAAHTPDIIKALRGE